MSDHTMGKLVYQENADEYTHIARFDGGRFFVQLSQEKIGVTKANCRRLVAAWNLCDGIPTEQIEGMDLGRLLAERGELMEALKEAREELRLVRMKDGAVYDPTLCVRIDTIIAKCEGKS